ncbi:ubiquitin-specific protease [Rhizoctonia solani]|uniref:ubiquitinyl hydrolase 1 n=1 Tax=Rhizoctonia solani TaxID=456999 RepID=A0A8H7LGD9_9AGAM|nr:ubiquitin-specific protease [Rhizoctonia solani]
MGEATPQTRYQQHDTQQFLGFLLGGLHKDLNRVLKNPYVKKPEWPEEGGNEKAVAKETWEGYKKRNKSIIVDLFQSMYKSTLVYPECSKISITFDPFMYLTLPLPVTKTWRHIIHWVTWDTRKRTLAVEIEVPKDPSYGYLKKLFAKWFRVKAESLLAAKVWSHKFYKFYDDYVNLTELAKKDTLVAYELPVPVKSIAKPPPQTSSFTFGAKPKPSPKTDPSAPFLLPGFHISEAQRSTAFGVPFFVLPLSKDEDGEGELVEQIPPKADEADEAVTKIRPQADEMKVEVVRDVEMQAAQEIVAKEEASTEHAQDDGKLASLAEPQGEEDFENEDGSAVIVEKLSQPTPLVKPTDALVRQWSLPMQTHFFGSESLLFDEWEEHSIDLEDCLNEFTKEEQLGEEDLLYCLRRKKHQQATKRFELWSVPNIFVVRLKRFSNARAMQDKIHALVEFPISELDLSTRVGESGQSDECVYDLFAVDEHMGVLGGGDYWAYAKNLSDGKWYHFEDSYVSKSSAEDSVNANASLLFYQRRLSDSKAVIEKICTRVYSNQGPDSQKSIDMGGQSVVRVPDKADPPLFKLPDLAIS